MEQGVKQESVGAVIELSNAEREALSRVLRRYGQERMDMVSFDLSDLQEVQGDYSPGLYTEDEVDHAVASTYRRGLQLEDETAGQIEPFDDLALQVERSGQVDLADDGVRALLKEALEHTGLAIQSDDPYQYPHEWYRVAEGIRREELITEMGNAVADMRRSPGPEMADKVLQVASRMKSWESEIETKRNLHVRQDTQGIDSRTRGMNQDQGRQRISVRAANQHWQPGGASGLPGGTPPPPPPTSGGMGI